MLIIIIVNYYLIILWNDYKDAQHRGFAFIEFEEEEDTLAAIDNMHLSELFGRVIKVNLTKPSKLRENMNKPSNYHCLK